MPSIQEELRRNGKRPTDRELALEKREERAEAKEGLPEREIHHRVPPEKRVCPQCGGTDLKPLGPGKVTTVYEYVPARLEKQVHIQETLACRCGEGIVTAEGAPKAIEQGHYGQGFIAHVVTAKCADSIPLYRQAKAFE